MGTNYYTVKNICEHCHRHDRDLHIGKSSAGWTFSFQGYRADYHVPKIETYEQWLDMLKEERIFDEYGEEITLAELKEIVEKKRSEPNNHTTYVEIHHPDHAKNCWLDGQGNSFTGVEFS